MLHLFLDIRGLFFFFFNHWAFIGSQDCVCFLLRQIQVAKVTYSCYVGGDRDVCNEGMVGTLSVWPLRIRLWWCHQYSPCPLTNLTHWWSLMPLPNRKLPTLEPQIKKYQVRKLKKIKINYRIYFWHSFSCLIWCVIANFGAKC